MPPLHLAAQLRHEIESEVISPRSVIKLHRNRPHSSRALVRRRQTAVSHKRGGLDGSAAGRVLHFARLEVAFLGVNDAPLVQAPVVRLAICLVHARLALAVGLQVVEFATVAVPSNK